MLRTRERYGLGGYDPLQPNGNIVESEQYTVHDGKLTQQCLRRGIKIIASTTFHCWESAAALDKQNAVNDAIRELWADGTFLQGPDLWDINTDDNFHVTTTEKANEWALRWWNALDKLYYAPPTAPAKAARDVTGGKILWPV